MSAKLEAGGPPGGGGDGDPMELYQVFQNSFNKIARNEYNGGAQEQQHSYAGMTAGGENGGLQQYQQHQGGPPTMSALDPCYFNFDHQQASSSVPPPPALRNDAAGGVVVKSDVDGGKHQQQQQEQHNQQQNLWYNNDPYADPSYYQHHLADQQHQWAGYAGGGGGIATSQFAGHLDGGAAGAELLNPYDGGSYGPTLAALGGGVNAAGGPVVPTSGSTVSPANVNGAAAPHLTSFLANHIDFQEVSSLFRYTQLLGFWLFPCPSRTSSSAINCKSLFYLNQGCGARSPPEPGFLEYIHIHILYT